MNFVSDVFSFETLLSNIFFYSDYVRIGIGTNMVSDVVGFDGFYDFKDYIFWNDSIELFKVRWPSEVLSKA